MAEITPAIFENFRGAFHANVGSCRGECACGVTFYSGGNWDWEEGELEALEKDLKARYTPDGVSFVEFEGCTYVEDCTCWHERAKKIIGFIIAHGTEIAEFLSREKMRKVCEARLSPVVREVNGG